MRPDTVTNTPEDAAAYEIARGRDEWIGDIDSYTEVRTPFCSRCQRGTKDYVCGPCRREQTPTWWCIRCETPQWAGEPEDQCTSCGYTRSDQ